MSKQLHTIYSSYTRTITNSALCKIIIEQSEKQLAADFKQIIRNPADSVIKSLLNLEENKHIITDIEALESKEKNFIIRAFSSWQHIDQLIHHQHLKAPLFVGIVKAYLNSMTNIQEEVKNKERDENIVKELNNFDIRGLNESLPIITLEGDSIIIRFITDWKKEIEKITGSNLNNPLNMTPCNLAIFDEFQKYCHERSQEIGNNIQNIGQGIKNIEKMVQELISTVEDLQNLNDLNQWEEFAFKPVAEKVAEKIGHLSIEVDTTIKEIEKIEKTVQNLELHGNQPDLFNEV